MRSLLKIGLGALVALQAVWLFTPGVANADPVTNTTVSLPVNLCGNGVGLLGIGLALCSTSSSGSGSVISTGPTNVVAAAPVNVCGNAVAVAGRSTGACGSSRSGPAVSSSTGSGSNSHGSLISAGPTNIVAAAPVNVCGNAVGVIGRGTGACGSSGAAPTTSIATLGSLPVGGSLVSTGPIAVGVAVPVNVCGNVVFVLGFGQGGCSTSSSNQTTALTGGLLPVGISGLLGNTTGSLLGDPTGSLLGTGTSLLGDPTRSLPVGIGGLLGNTTGSLLGDPTGSLLGTGTGSLLGTGTGSLLGVPSGSLLALGPVGATVGAPVALCGNSVGVLNGGELSSATCPGSSPTAPGDPSTPVDPSTPLAPIVEAGSGLAGGAPAASASGSSGSSSQLHPAVVSAASAAGGSLPFTGSNDLVLVGLAVLLLTVGGVVASAAKTAAVRRA
jgi:hypothetical protein